MNLPKKWSFSSLSAFRQCPMMWKLLYIDGGVRQQNAYAEFGTFCHKL